MEIHKKIEDILKGGEGSGWFRDDPETPHVAGAKGGDIRAEAREEEKKSYESYKDRQKAGFTQARKELKEIFPKTKFSVTKDRDTMNVAWTDGPAVSQVKKIVGKFEGKSFDGMQDLESYTPAHKQYSIGYVFARREVSKEALDGIYEDYAKSLGKDIRNADGSINYDISETHPNTGNTGWTLYETAHRIARKVDLTDGVPEDKSYIDKYYNHYGDKVLNKQLYVELLDIAKGGVGSGRYPKGSGKKLLEERLGENHKALGMEVDKVHESENDDVKHTIVRMKPREGSELTRHYLIEEHKDDPKKDLIYANSFLNGTMIASQKVEHINPNDIKEDAGLTIPARISAKEYTTRYGKGTVSHPLAKGGVGSGRYPAGSGAHPKKEPSVKEQAVKELFSGSYFDRQQPPTRSVEFKTGEKEKLINDISARIDRIKVTDSETKGFKEGLQNSRMAIQVMPNKLKAVEHLGQLEEQMRVGIKELGKAPNAHTKENKELRLKEGGYVRAYSYYKEVLENQIYGNG